MSTRRGKALFVTGAVLFGAATFLLASSYLIEREQPKWLAAAVGALAFPVLPVVWQWIGERRRKARIAAAKTPPKESLAPSDRYIMRAIAVALVVIGPQLFIGKLDVVRAAWNHKTWFVPEPVTSYEEGRGTASKTALLAHVPADAEAVVVVREADLNGKKGSGLFAYGDHQLLVIAPDDGLPVADKLKEINAKRDKIPFLKIDPLVEVDGPSDTVMLASEKWKSKVASAGVGPSVAIKTELDRAPDNAAAVFALVPTKSPEMATIKTMSAWLVVDQDKKRMIADARVEAVDAKAADGMMDVLRGIVKEKSKDVPEQCRGQVDAILDDVKLERDGLVVTFHLDLKSDKLMALMFCGMKIDD